VGRFHPQLAIIADFFDTLVNTQIQNEALHRQLLEAHARFGELVRASITPPASKVDQAQQAASGITGNNFDLLIVDDQFERRSAAIRISEKILANLPNLNVSKLPVKYPTPPKRTMCNLCVFSLTKTAECKHA
jgi:hypothetical protein